MSSLAFCTEHTARCHNQHTVLSDRCCRHRSHMGRTQAHAHTVQLPQVGQRPLLSPLLLSTVIGFFHTQQVLLVRDTQSFQHGWSFLPCFWWHALWTMGRKLSDSVLVNGVWPSAFVQLDFSPRSFK